MCAGLVGCVSVCLSGCQTVCIRRPAYLCDGMRAVGGVLVCRGCHWSLVGGSLQHNAVPVDTLRCFCFLVCSPGCLVLALI